jgi:glutaredoxin
LKDKKFMKKIIQDMTILVLSAWVASAPYAQTLYKSVGPDGRVIYSDHPPISGQIEKTLKFENLPASTLPPSKSTYLDQLRKTKGASQPDIPITGAVLYSAAWCGYCKMAKSYMASKGISYQEVDIDTNSGMAAYAKAGGGKGIPLLLAGGQSVVGFSPAAYDALFSIRR